MAVYNLIYSSPCRYRDGEISAPATGARDIGELSNVRGGRAERRGGNAKDRKLNVTVPDNVTVLRNLKLHF